MCVCLCPRIFLTTYPLAGRKHCLTLCLQTGQHIHREPSSGQRSRSHRSESIGRDLFVTGLQIWSQGQRGTHVVRRIEAG